MPAIIPLIAAGVAVGGVVAGSAAGAKNRKAAEEAAKQAVAYLESVGIPSIDAQKIALENPQFVGQFLPEGETAQTLAPSEMAEVSTDPRLAKAQMAALEQLEQQGKTPLTETERAELGQIRRSVASEAQARQGAILQNMAARGAGGSGMELAAQLQASQAAAQRQGEESDRTAALMQQRAYAAIAGAGELGGSIRRQEFGEKSDQARAADIIAQANWKNAQDVAQRNVAGRNEAELRKANLMQQMENDRVANLNFQNKYNKELLAQQYDMEMGHAQAMSGSANAQAAAQRAESDRKGKMGADIGKAASGGIMAFGGGGMPIPGAKTNIPMPTKSMTPDYTGGWSDTDGLEEVDPVTGARRKRMETA